MVEGPPSVRNGLVKKGTVPFSSSFSVAKRDPRQSETVWSKRGTAPSSSSLSVAMVEGPPPVRNGLVKKRCSTLSSSFSVAMVEPARQPVYFGSKRSTIPYCSSFAVAMVEGPPSVRKGLVKKKYTTLS